MISIVTKPPELKPHVLPAVHLPVHLKKRNQNTGRKKKHNQYQYVNKKNPSLPKSLSSKGEKDWRAILYRGRKNPREKDVQTRVCVIMRRKQNIKKK